MCDLKQKLPVLSLELNSPIAIKILESVVKALLQRASQPIYSGTLHVPYTLSTLSLPELQEVLFDNSFYETVIIMTRFRENNTPANLMSTDKKKIFLNKYEYLKPRTCACYNTS